MNIETLLYDAIETDFDKLAKTDLSPEERKATVDELTKLMDRAIEMEKVSNDCEDKTKTRESDEFYKQQQLLDDKKDRLVKNIISVAGVVLPLAVTIWGTKVSLKFEEEGTITTNMGRGFIQRLFPKK
jgi:hypothetical protein